MAHRGHTFLTVPLVGLVSAPLINVRCLAVRQEVQSIQYAKIRNAAVSVKNEVLEMIAKVRERKGTVILALQGLYFRFPLFWRYLLALFQKVLQPLTHFEKLTT